MVIGGEWVRDEDDVIRPYFWAHVTLPNGQDVHERFIVDSGADCSQLSYGLLVRLGFDVATGANRHAVVGIGGRADLVSVDAKLVFETTEGRTIIVNGPYLGSTDPTALDVSFLGRDVFANFDLILSRRRNAILLLGGNHTYAVTG
jgi:hypothetical protein